MGAEDGRNALKTGFGREKEPLVTSLATKYGHEKRNYSANLDVNLNRYKALGYQYLRTRNPLCWRGFAGRNFTVREIFPAYAAFVACIYIGCHVYHQLRLNVLWKTFLANIGTNTRVRSNPLQDQSA